MLEEGQQVGARRGTKSGHISLCRAIAGNATHWGPCEREGWIGDLAYVWSKKGLRLVLHACTRLSSKPIYKEGARLPVLDDGGIPPSPVMGR